MPGYIIVDVKTRKSLAICGAISVAVFLFGILIGYFSHPSSTSGGSNSSDKNESPNKGELGHLCREADFNAVEKGALYLRRKIERVQDNNACVQKPEDCGKFGLPRTYSAYHLNGKSLVVDGRLNDSAWAEVQWTEPFSDIRSTEYPDPYYVTKVKVRWDDEKLYIGAYLQERDLWAVQTEHDSRIFLDRGFEMLMDVDGSMFNYKQIQINVLGTMMDQLLYKSPHDSSENTKLRAWAANVEASVWADGTINQPGDNDTGWSIEMAVTFESLAMLSQRQTPGVSDNDVWFIQFGRSEPELVVENGAYMKPRNGSTSWWSWQPCDAVNLHLQDRWGLVQFKREMADKEFSFPLWHVYKALFDMLTAMKKYKAINGKYVDTIQELDIPPYLLTRMCVDVPEIRLVRNRTWSDFDVSVKSMSLQHKPAHIRSDKYVWFD